MFSDLSWTGPVAVLPWQPEESAVPQLSYAQPMPLANLHLTLLDKVGVRLDKFGDSTGKIDGLLDPLSV